MPYVTRLTRVGVPRSPEESVLVEGDECGASFAGRWGMVAIEGAGVADLDGDVVLVNPAAHRVDRVIRARSSHNTLLVTERCDQLCVMCSQPPKKTHIDRFDALEQACLLAPEGLLIGVSGGEPTLYKDRLLAMVERVLGERPDLAFHILSNGQHFERGDIGRLRNPLYRRVSWGIPLYAAEPALHDNLVGKTGAFERLEASFACLLGAGARIELRTVLLQPNVGRLEALARHISVRLRFIEVWSIMQLENIGFARNRWRDLFVQHESEFVLVAAALDLAALHGIDAQLFNFPRCSVPAPYRRRARASISDWKRRYMTACGSCGEREACCGFFEWHPEAGVTPL